VEHSTTDGGRRLDQLMKQAGFAHARLTHNSDDLAMTPPCAFDSRTELLHLGIAPAEAAQTPALSSLKTCSGCDRIRQLEDFDRRLQPLHRHRTEWLDLHEGLDQREGPSGDPDSARRCELLHSRCEVRRLPDRRIVETQVGPNRPDDDLA